MTKPNTTKAGRLAALAAVALLASACANAQATGPDTGRRTAAHATPKSPAAPSATSGARSGEKPQAAVSGGASDTPAAQPPAPATPPDCTVADLGVSLERGDGAAGSVYWQLVMKNQSDHACETGPFAGVSYVDKDNAQVGSPATWTLREQGHTVLLEPGAAASATLQETNAFNYPDDKCRPAPAEGLRVYPSGQTDSVIVAQAGATACADSSVHLLTLRPFLLEQ